MLEWLYNLIVVLAGSFTAFVLLFIGTNCTEIVKDPNKKWQYTIFGTVIVAIVFCLIRFGVEWYSAAIPIAVGWFIYKLF